MTTYGCNCSTSKPEEEQNKETDKLRPERAEKGMFKSAVDHTSTVFDSELMVRYHGQ